MNCKTGVNEIDKTSDSHVLKVAGLAPMYYVYQRKSISRDFILYYNNRYQCALISAKTTLKERSVRR